jgi:hypothetical protein
MIQDQVYRAPVETVSYSFTMIQRIELRLFALCRPRVRRSVLDQGDPTGGEPIRTTETEASGIQYSPRIVFVLV